MGGAWWIWVGNGALWQLEDLPRNLLVLYFIISLKKWCLSAKSLRTALLAGGSIAHAWVRVATLPMVRVLPRCSQVNVSPSPFAKPCSGCTGCKPTR